MHACMHTLHYITLHYITLHYIHTYTTYTTYTTYMHAYIHTLHYITLHYITLHYSHTYIYIYTHSYPHVPQSRTNGFPWNSHVNRLKPWNIDSLLFPISLRRTSLYQVWEPCSIFSTVTWKNGSVPQGSETLYVFTFSPWYGALSLLGPG